MQLNFEKEIGLRTFNGNVLDAKRGDDTIQVSIWISHQNDLILADYNIMCFHAISRYGLCNKINCV